MLGLEKTFIRKAPLCLTIDVEEWFHILGSPGVPRMEHWSGLESRVERNLDRLLALLASTSAKSTFFWLGWVAERQKALVRRCRAAGHEIASHGYAHVLAHEVGREAFREDVIRSKAILEDILGEPVRGFRAAGFSITQDTAWAFDVLKAAGYEYDTSIFPAHHGHGGMSGTPRDPYFIETRCGHLLEIPASVLEIFGHRVSLFGGGYLRLATKPLIKWGLDRLEGSGQPPVIYVHPREIDPSHPRLPLSWSRRLKCYLRLKSTLSKLEWLCRHYEVCTMLEMVEDYIRSFYYQSKILPVVKLGGDGIVGGPRFLRETGKTPGVRPLFRDRILKVENAMATFLSGNTASTALLNPRQSPAAASTSGPPKDVAFVHTLARV